MGKKMDRRANAWSIVFSLHDQATLVRARALQTSIGRFSTPIAITHSATNLCPHGAV